MAAGTQELELTDRELAIAQGTKLEDLDAGPTVDEVQEERHAADEPVDEPVDEVADEPVDETGEQEVDSDPPAETENWIDETTRQLAASYGMTDEDLQDLSPAEFAKLGRVLDKQASLYRQQLEQTPPPAETKPADKETEKPWLKDGVLNIDYFKEKGFGDDDESLLIVEEMRQIQQRQLESEQRLNFANEYIRQQEEIHQYQQFHSALDELENERPGMYGKSVDKDGNYVQLNEQQQNRRAQILDAMVSTILPNVLRQNELSGQNTPPPSYAVLARRAESMLFGKEVQKLESEQRAAKLKSQSAKRRPVGATSTGALARAIGKSAEQNGPQSIAEESQELANDPKITAAWNDIISGNG